MPRTVYVELTRRESECAILVGRGMSLQAIANKLGVCLATVVGHLRHARVKTGAWNTTHLAVMVALARAKKKGELNGEQ